MLVADNGHRDIVRDVVSAGGGVGRLLDWHSRAGEHLASGALVPALADWHSLEVPPVNLLYPPSVRRAPLRAFSDFVTQLFRGIELQRERRSVASAPPQWLKTRSARAAATAGRGR